MCNCTARPVIRSGMRQYSANGVFDCSAIQGVIDTAVKNDGNSDVTVLLNDSAPFVLKSGDAMLSLGGYIEATRDDIIRLEFAGGSGLVTIGFTKRIC